MIPLPEAYRNVFWIIHGNSCVEVCLPFAQNQDALQFPSYVKKANAGRLILPERAICTLCFNT